MDERKLAMYNNYVNAIEQMIKELVSEYEEELRVLSADEIVNVFKAKFNNLYEYNSKVIDNCNNRKFKFNYDVLKQYIKKSPFTIEEICELIGLANQTYYFQIKNNRLSVNHLLIIADVLKLTDEQLLKILKK